MRSNPSRLGSNVILESSLGVTLQLRDDLHLWGIFGGLVEDGEDPLNAAIREVQEELTIRLDPSLLSLLKIFQGPDITTHLFHYPVTSELDGAILTEGIRHEAKMPGDLEADQVVPWHWHMLNWYWQSATNGQREV